MIGILIATHANLAVELYQAARLIVGDQSQVLALPLQDTDNLESYQKRLSDAVGLLDTGRGVLILTDLLGGTPANATISLIGRKAHIACLTGANLPMLLEAIAQRDQECSVTALAGLCKKAAQQGIVNVTELLTKQMSSTDTGSDS